MRGSLGVRSIDEGDEDTLTESCEGAVNFMVIEMMDGSLLELPEMRSEGKDCDAVKAEGRITAQAGGFLLLSKKCK